MGNSQPQVVSQYYPYTIKGGLHPGMTALIRGCVPSDANRFQIDFTVGSSISPRADVAFHFNPRFTQNCIICNTLRNGRWDYDEKSYTMALTKDKDFEILVLVEKEGYKVAVDGTHILEYEHRIDLEKVDTMLISGAVMIKEIQVIPKATPESAPPPPAVESPAKAKVLLQKEGDLLLPFRKKLEQGMSPGDTIAIKGQLGERSHGFVVNLHVDKSEDIALHLNPRPKAKVFISNSYLSESWGQEETSKGGFPFTPGKYFELLIRCEALHFRVAVNGVHHLDYKHRVQDVRRINELEIMGDLQLMGVDML